MGQTDDDGASAHLICNCGAPRRARREHSLVEAEEEETIRKVSPAWSAQARGPSSPPVRQMRPRLYSSISASFQRPETAVEQRTAESISQYLKAKKAEWESEIFV